MAAPLEAGAPKEVTVRWEELAPLVEKRQIETVLANGVHIRGRAEQVLREALVVRSSAPPTRSSCPKAISALACTIGDYVGAPYARFECVMGRNTDATGGVVGLRDGERTPPLSGCPTRGWAHLGLR